MKARLQKCTDQMWVLYHCKRGITNYRYNGDHECIWSSYHCW